MIATKLKLFLDTNLTKDPNIRTAEQGLERQLPRNILLNILRASAYEPLEFSSKAAGNSNSDIFQPIGFDQLNYFIRGGYPRELLFRLFTDYVNVKLVRGDPQGHGAFTIYNDPSAVNRCLALSAGVVNRLYPDGANDSQLRICFDDVVKFALLSGLSAEIRFVPSSSDSNSSTPVPALVEGRLCFDGALANRAQYQLTMHKGPIQSFDHFLEGVRSAEYHPVCGGTTGIDRWLTGAASKSQPAPASDSTTATVAKSPTAVVASSSIPVAGVQALLVAMNSASPTGAPLWDIGLLGNYTIEIGTRSTLSIYNFLGQLLNNQESSANLLTESQDEDPDPRLLTVNKGQSAGCFALTSFDDDVYCVPAKGVQNTKRVFSLLAQLSAQ